MFASYHSFNGYPTEQTSTVTNRARRLLLLGYSQKSVNDYMDFFLDGGFCIVGGSMSIVSRIVIAVPVNFSVIIIHTDSERSL